MYLIKHRQIVINFNLGYSLKNFPSSYRQKGTPLTNCRVSDYSPDTLFVVHQVIACTKRTFTCYMLVKTWGGYTLLPITGSFWLSSSKLHSFLREKEVGLCLFCHSLYTTTVTVYTFILLETFWRHLVWSLCHLMCSVCPSFLGNTYRLLSHWRNC